MSAPAVYGGAAVAGGEREVLHPHGGHPLHHPPHLPRALPVQVLFLFWTELRIRSIFGRILLRIRILQIRVLKPDPGSYWHLNNQFKHQKFFHTKHISSHI